MTRQTNARDFRVAAAAMKRPKAVADAAAENWEKVLGRLDAYLPRA
jgi:hypothetical protein